VHTDWSDGGDTLEAMVAAAAAQGHDYVVLTDHSPRLTIARGLTPDRLRRQLEAVTAVNDALGGTGFRVLTGIEVDILPDGSLDQEPELLAQLDVVVGSVHGELRMEKAKMTRRMLTALADPHLDILGHCTGRKLPVATDARHTARGGTLRRRAPSGFDADAVFAAAARYGKAVEINSRPDRLDPPANLLRKAAKVDGLRFAVNTDAHAAAQLDWLGHGCARAEAAGITGDRIVNTLPAGELLAWTRTHGP
jgi:putative hydrolase